MNKIKSIIFTAAFVATGLAGAVQPASAAGAASLNVSPNGSRYVGGTFSAVVTENSGATAVNGVEADLVYDTSKLQFLGKSCSGSFEVSAPSGGSNLACATVSPKSGVQTVGTFSFKVLAPGTATMSFASSSQITAADGQGTNVWNGAPAAAAVGFVTPQPVAPTAAPTPTPAPAAPVVKAEKKTAVKVAAPTAKEDSTTWQEVAAWTALALVIIGGLAYIFRNKLSAITKKTKKSTSKGLKGGLSLKTSASIKK
jgi:hypothetical protein